MATSRRARRKRSTWHSPGTIGVALVMVLAGLLFTANARVSRDNDRNPTDFRTLVRQEVDRLDAKSLKVEQLQSDVDRLASEVAGSGDVPQASVDVQIAAGNMPVTGPGIRVVLNDAPASAVKPADVPADQLVVHQQDIEGVLNAMWAGGAEAITVQGQRITSTTAVRCHGNVLLLHGQTYSPPYTIEAIGNSDQLTASVIASPQVKIYLEWVDLVDLGWDLSTRTSLSMPGYDGSGTGPRYAKVSDQK